MLIDKSEVESFLMDARALVGCGRRNLVPRRENLDGLRELDISLDQGWELVSRLTVNNYCKGPEDDDDGSETSIWVFGASIERKAVYIKLKIEESQHGRLLKCLSIHPAKYVMSFPHRPRY